MHHPTPEQLRACDVLAGLYALFHHELYRIEFWWHGPIFSARVTNRSTHAEYVAVWSRAVSPESVVQAAARWKDEGEPAWREAGE